MERSRSVLERVSAVAGDEEGDGAGREVSVAGMLGWEVGLSTIGVISVPALGLISLLTGWGEAGLAL